VSKWIRISIWIHKSKVWGRGSGSASGSVTPLCRLYGFSKPDQSFCPVQLSSPSIPEPCFYPVQLPDASLPLFSCPPICTWTPVLSCTAVSLSVPGPSCCPVHCTDILLIDICTQLLFCITIPSIPGPSYRPVQLSSLSIPGPNCCPVHLPCPYKLYLIQLLSCPSVQPIYTWAQLLTCPSAQPIHTWPSCFPFSCPAHLYLDPTAVLSIYPDHLYLTQLLSCPSAQPIHTWPSCFPFSCPAHL
jgi:hypothetical protein